MTQYIDLFQTLNKDFFTHEHPVSDSYAFESTSRNRLVTVPDIQHRLQSVFLWKSTMFERQHKVRFPKPILCLKGNGTPMLNVDYHWSTEYFHFITEVLTSVLHAYKDYPGVSIYCKTSSFTIPLLRWFGVDGSVSQTIPKNSMEIEAPFVECGNISPYKLSLLREKIEKKVTFERTHGILIRRQKSRQITNETEVFMYLRRKFPHLQWVIFDSLSVEDTANLFAKASIIFAPHGAGLTNMIFSPPETRIIECMPIELPNVCYWHMSEMLKNPYTMIPIHVKDYKSDMYVDVKALDSLLD